MSTPLSREAALTLEHADEEYGLARPEPDLQADPAAQHKTRKTASRASNEEGGQVRAEPDVQAESTPQQKTRKTANHTAHNLSTSSSAGGKEARSPSHAAPHPHTHPQSLHHADDAPPPPADDVEPESDLFSAPPAGPAAHSFSLGELSAMSPEQLLYEFRVVNQRADGFKRAHEVLRRHLNAQLQPARIATLSNRITELEGHLKNVLGENRTLTLELKRLDKLTPEARAAEDLTEALTRQTEQTKHFRDKVREYQAAEHERDKALRRAQQQITSLEATNKHLKDKYGLNEEHARTHSPVRGGGAGAGDDANGAPFAQTMPPRDSCSPQPAAASRAGVARTLSPIRSTSSQGAVGGVQSAPAMDRSTLLALKSLQKDLDKSSKDKARLQQLSERYKKQVEDLKSALDLTKRLLNKARQTKPAEESRSRSRKAPLPANGGPSRSPSRSPTRKATTLPDINASLERAALRKSRSDARLARTAKAASDRLLAASQSEKALGGHQPNAWQDQYTDNTKYTHKTSPSPAQNARAERIRQRTIAARGGQPENNSGAAAETTQDSAATDHTPPAAASAPDADADSAAAPASSTSPPPPHSHEDDAPQQQQQQQPQHSQPPVAQRSEEEKQNDAAGGGGGNTFLTSDNDEEEAASTPAAAPASHAAPAATAASLAAATH